jgi:hypothetical protein
MKRHLILIVSVLVVLGLAWVSFGQPEGSAGKSSAAAAGQRNRRGMWRQRQQKAVSAIEEQLAKIKAGMESFPTSRQSWQDLSEEERNELRGKFRKVREERQKSIVLIEDQIAMLKGRRSLDREHEKSIGELNGILELAKNEKATQTATAIEKLVAGKKKQFEERMQKLDLSQRSGRRGR